MKGKSRQSNRLTYAVLGIAMAAIFAGLAFGIEACGSSNSSTPTVRKGLWVANSGGPTVLEFLAGQTTVRGISDPTPHFINDSGFFFSPQDVVFDPSGNLWVIDGGDGDGDDTEGVFEFTAGQLQQLGNTPDPDPAFAITNVEGVPGLVFPQFGIFDSSGNLYVADPGINVIFLFTAQQLTSSSGDGLTPAAVFQIQNSTAVLGEAFDGSGNLFVADNGAAQIFRINQANIPIGGGTASSPTVITPDVVLSSNNNTTFASIDAPWGLVFDGGGNLWLTNEGFSLESGPSVVRFPRNLITVSGTPFPTAQITSTTFGGGNESIDDPQGISFDNLSNLAIANDANNTISIFGSNQLLDSSPIPNVFIVGDNTTLNAPTGLIFGPNIH
jgi:hypothetical protein